MYARLPETDLEFNHFVVAKDDGTIFASARDGRNKIQNFLITRYGIVKRQVSDHFEAVTREDAAIIREKARYYYGRVPVRKISTMRFS